MTIEGKVKSLKKKYDKAKKKGMYENMGNKYIDEFDDFIGDIYMYSYKRRLQIVALKKDLFNYVSI